MTFTVIIIIIIKIIIILNYRLTKMLILVNYTNLDLLFGCLHDGMECIS